MKSVQIKNPEQLEERQTSFRKKDQAYTNWIKVTKAWCYIYSGGALGGDDSLLWPYYILGLGPVGASLVFCSHPSRWAITHATLMDVLTSETSMTFSGMHVLVDNHEAPWVLRCTHVATQDQVVVQEGGGVAFRRDGLEVYLDGRKCGKTI